MPETKSSGATAHVTSHDVARKAGVSVMTVSRAMSGEGYVAEKTREKVLAAARELGYTPNLSARMMKGSRTNVIGVLVNDLLSTVINEIVGAVSVSLRKCGMDLIIYNSIEDLGASGRSGVQQMLRNHCDGLLFVLPRLSEGYIEYLEGSSQPTVLVNYCRTDTTLPVVGGANYAGGVTAAEYLLGLGHRRIGFIAGSPHTGQSQERERGYKAALKKAGVRSDRALVAQGDFGQRSGFEGAQKLLRLPDPPTAIFAANDDMAIGAINAAHSLGLRVPDDVSVVGFDDIPSASHLHPRLTTLRQPLADISEAAVMELVRRINNAEGQQHRIDFPCELVVRESTAAAPLRSAA